ncbi:hypothetical protein PAL_GLEAN10002855 [Pteropus alecto]|uniref:Uncharacterized protein n=1 Tax=Pteropus alecto TaxID=9402 RepID=L5KUV3_PTEAL|nr:hypothetical protein PAL_GLEAN10002855 [Pteropus alecto]
MGPGRRPGWARSLPRPLRTGLRAGHVTKAPAEEELQGEDRGREVQVPVSADSSSLSKLPKPPPPPPPRALWPRIRLRSHFRHCHRPERKYLSRDAARQGGAPPQSCVTFWPPLAGPDHVLQISRLPYGCRHH